MKCPNTHPENNAYCPSEAHMIEHNTDQYSTYYCPDCGFEDKVVWPVPVKQKRERFEMAAPTRRRNSSDRKRRDG
jgi:hypothetical protein